MNYLFGDNNIKLTEEENTQLRKDAYAHEMNVTDYIKWLVKKEREEKDGKAD